MGTGASVALLFHAGEDELLAANVSRQGAAGDLQKLF